MAFEAKLTIGNSIYEALECEYEFSQSLEQTGKPATRSRGGHIIIVLKSTGDDDMFFQEWMSKQTEAKSGSIEFIISGEGEKRKIKTISFDEAYCINYYEHFNHDNSVLMYMRITLSAAVVKFGGKVEFKSDWSK